MLDPTAPTGVREGRRVPPPPQPPPPPHQRLPHCTHSPPITPQVRNIRTTFTLSPHRNRHHGTHVNTKIQHQQLHHKYSIHHHYYYHHHHTGVVITKHTISTTTTTTNANTSHNKLTPTQSDTMLASPHKHHQYHYYL